MAGVAGIVVGALGGCVLGLAATDVFITVFNYDGFEFLATRLHRVVWMALRVSSQVLPGRLRASYLSLGSAVMLPLTLLWWLALEVTGFAMMFLPGLAAGDFGIRGVDLTGAQGAFYLSGGDITSLTFGDVIARSPIYRALTDLETVIGLATFTIGLTFVLSAFDALGSLNQLHGRVRRHAIRPNQPSSILTRHFRAGRADELTGLVQALVEDLASYDDALRRYPVVFYFHTRRAERSIPLVYSALGQLIELLRWGLPSREDTTSDPYVLALEEQFSTTGTRLLDSFVGPVPALGSPLTEPEFACRYRAGTDPVLRAFAHLRAEAAEAANLSADVEPVTGELYAQYREWVVFHDRRCTVEQRLRRALCYGEDASV